MIRYTFYILCDPCLIWLGKSGSHGLKYPIGSSRFGPSALDSLTKDLIWLGETSFVIFYLKKSSSNIVPSKSKLKMKKVLQRRWCSKDWFFYLWRPHFREMNVARSMMLLAALVINWTTKNKGPLILPLWEQNESKLFYETTIFKRPPNILSHFIAAISSYLK